MAILLVIPAVNANNAISTAGLKATHAGDVALNQQQKNPPGSPVNSQPAITASTSKTNNRTPNPMFASSTSSYKTPKPMFASSASRRPPFYRLSNHKTK